MGKSNISGVASTNSQCQYGLQTNRRVFDQTGDQVIAVDFQ